MNTGNDISMLNIRGGSLSIDEENFSNAVQMARAGLVFNIDQISTTIESMMIDGEPVEDRAAYADKRRRAFQLLEILDGVSHSLPMEEDGPSHVIINDHQLSKNMVDVLRQSLLIYKNFKARDTASIRLIEKMASYMAYGKEEALARAEAAAQKA